MKKHIELNNKNSSYTGNATYFFGEDIWDKKQFNSFISISDCYNTIRLHPNTNCFNDKELKDFKKKLVKLRNFIDDFINILPNKMPKDSKCQNLD